MKVINNGEFPTLGLCSEFFRANVLEDECWITCSNLIPGVTLQSESIKLEGLDNERNGSIFSMAVDFKQEVLDTIREKIMEVTYGTRYPIIVSDFIGKESKEEKHNFLSHVYVSLDGAPLISKRGDEIYNGIVKLGILLRMRDYAYVIFSPLPVGNQDDSNHPYTFISINTERTSLFPKDGDLCKGVYYQDMTKKDQEKLKAILKDLERYGLKVCTFGIPGDESDCQYPIRVDLGINIDKIKKLAMEEEDE